MEPAAIRQQPDRCAARGHGASALPPAAAAGNDQRIALVIGGAVPTRTIVGDALALDTYSVGVLVFLLLLGFLGFPFVKLASSMLTNVSVSATSTCCTEHRSPARALDMRVARGGRIREMAARLQGRASGPGRRLSNAVPPGDRSHPRPVADYDAQLASRTPGGTSTRQWSKGTACEKWPVQTDWFRGGQSPGQPLRGSPATERPSPDRSCGSGPMAGSCGRATADSIPGKSRVDHACLFPRRAGRHLFQVAGSGRPLFLGPDRSLADGKFYTFSRCSRASQPLCARSG